MPLSAEQIAEIQEALGASIETKIAETVAGAMGKPLNDALTKRMSAFEKSFSATMEGTIGKALEGLKPAGGVANPPVPDKDSVALKTMESKMESVLTKLADAESRASAERAKNRSSALHTAVSDHLSKLGMTDPIGLKLAVGHLTTVERRAQYEDDESDSARILFRNDDDTLMDLGVGLKKWAATPEAKHFMPPTGARGSGSNPNPKTTSVGGASLTKQQQEEIVFNALQEALGR